MRNRRGRCGRCQRQTDPYTLESNKRELVCTTVLLSELNWFISGGKYQPEWKKRKVCQFLKVQRGEGEKCFAAFPSSMPNCSEPFSICNPESTWKNFAWSKSNMNGDVSAGVHALIFGVYAENKCMLFVSCAPLCAVYTFVRVYICEEGKDGSERRKKSDGRVNIPVPLLGPITLWWWSSPPTIDFIHYLSQLHAATSIFSHSACLLVQHTHKHKRNSQPLKHPEKEKEKSQKTW